MCMCRNYLIWQLTLKPYVVHTQPAKKKTIDYAQKIEREFLLVKGVQQRDFDIVMSIDVTAGNDPMRQQRLANMTSYKCGYKGHYRKTALVQLVQVQAWIKLQ